jgi:hypothetical protein
VHAAPDFSFYHKLMAVILRKARKHEAGPTRHRYLALVLANVGVINDSDRFQNHPRW